MSLNKLFILPLTVFLWSGGAHSESDCKTLAKVKAEVAEGQCELIVKTSYGCYDLLSKDLGLRLKSNPKGSNYQTEVIKLKKRYTRSRNVIEVFVGKTLFSGNIHGKTRGERKGCPERKVDLEELIEIMDTDIKAIDPLIKTNQKQNGAHRRGQKKNSKRNPYYSQNESK